ncbi:MAG: hypothetical protein KDH86_13250, partial [Anaerolineae bacterium]|nr:hypothetical protein [Anaerolineae bacterium]
MKAFQIARRVALSSAFLGVLLVLAGVWSRPALAVDCNSLITGNWTADGTWSCNHVPSAADNVIINSGHTVTIPESAGDQDVHSVILSGTLIGNSYELHVGGNWSSSGT